MKTKRNILIFEVLAIAAVLAIFIWQLSTLPTLRIQVKSGLDNGLQHINEDCAQALNRDFSQVSTAGIHQLAHQLSQADLNQVNDLTRVFYPIAANHPINEGWLLAIPDSSQASFHVFGYKKPSRYRKNSGTRGLFRQRTILSKHLAQTLNTELKSDSGLVAFQHKHWLSAVDSNLVYTYSNAFQRELLIGFPIFKDKKFKGLVFSQLSSWYFEKVYLPTFFREKYWQEEVEKKGLEKRHLQFGVIDQIKDRQMFNSIAYGKQDFEHRLSLAEIGSYLKDVSVGIGFRDASVAQVANSIYQRNLYLIIALFAVLLILLALIFFSAIRLLKLSRLKTEFIANVSHEIKTPLASIKLATDTLRLGRADNPERLQSLVHILGKETARLQHLLETLLDFSQLESGKKPYQMAELALEDWLGKVAAFFREECGADLVIQGKEKLHGKVRVDAKAMEQLFLILIDNARKYSSENSEITLGWSIKGGKIRVFLKDEGIGIKKEDQALIFQKFVRLNNLDEHNVQGHGIGLSIARAIAEDHGAKLGLNSKPGQGSTFFIDLPIKK